MARWMAGKPVVMDNLAWNLRPWEIEACHWQTRLVDEFLGLSTGQVTDQPVQSPKRRQLGLYPVSMPSPAIVPTQSEPVFGDVPLAAESDDMLSSAPAAMLTTDPEEVTEPQGNGHHKSVAEAEPGHNGIQMPDTKAPLAAMPDRPVYARPVIEVTVPGLDAPRALEREAMMKKLSEFRERGLAAADDAE